MTLTLNPKNCQQFIIKVNCPYINLNVQICYDTVLKSPTSEKQDTVQCNKHNNVNELE